MKWTLIFILLQNPNATYYAAGTVEFDDKKGCVQALNTLQQGFPSAYRDRLPIGFCTPKGTPPQECTIGADGYTQTCTAPELPAPIYPETRR